MVERNIIIERNVIFDITENFENEIEISKTVSTREKCRSNDKEKKIQDIKANELDKPNTYILKNEGYESNNIKSSNYMKNKNIIKAISGYSTEKLQSFSNANIIKNGKISYIDGNKLKDIISKFISI